MSEQSATRAELEVVARRLLGSTEGLGESAAKGAKIGVPAVGVLGALLAYAWGRRRGRRRTTIVEVRRTK